MFCFLITKSRFIGVNISKIIVMGHPYSHHSSISSVCAALKSLAIFGERVSYNSTNFRYSL